MSAETNHKFRDFSTLKKYKFNDEKYATVTSRDQQMTECSVEKCFDRFHQLLYLEPKLAKLHRAEHSRLLECMLRHLPTNYECLDCSRPWNVYWILQAGYLLETTFPDELLGNVVDFLIKCRAKTGGFGGGPGQMPHLAPTYAAVNALCMIGTHAAYNAIDRDSLIRFLVDLREPDGSFRVHLGGEIDVRGAYCAVSCAKLTNMPEDVLSKLFDKTGDWLASCQSYEGGFGGTPDLEAHGGYTFCGVAALALLNEGHKCDRQNLLKWSLQRQMPFEGGFQGRTNKLVDGCYSFWLGATIAITQAIMATADDKSKQCFFDTGSLQEYILLCCQNPHGGGLIDKPGKPTDLYHTCYTLSGVAIAQHAESTLHPDVLGEPINELNPTHPLFNVPPRAAAMAIQHFSLINSAAAAFDGNDQDDSSSSEIENKQVNNTNNIGMGEEHLDLNAADEEDGDDEEDDTHMSSVSS